MWPVESLVLEATIHRISWSRPVGLKHSTWLCSLSGPAACAARVADFFGWRVPSISRLWFIAEKFLLHRNWSKTFHLTVLGTFNSVLEDRIWPLMEFIPIQVHTVVHTNHVIPESVFLTHLASLSVWQARMGRAGQAVTIYCPEEYTKAGLSFQSQMQSCKQRCAEVNANGVTMEWQWSD